MLQLLTGALTLVSYLQIYDSFIILAKQSQNVGYPPVANVFIYFFSLIMDNKIGY